MSPHRQRQRPAWMYTFAIVLFGVALLLGLTTPMGETISHRMAITMLGASAICLFTGRL